MSTFFSSKIFVIFLAEICKICSREDDFLVDFEKCFKKCVFGRENRLRSSRERASERVMGPGRSSGRAGLTGAGWPEVRHVVATASAMGTEVPDAASAPQPRASSSWERSSLLGPTPRVRLVLGHDTSLFPRLVLGWIGADLCK